MTDAIKPTLDQITKGLKICTSSSNSCSKAGNCDDCYLNGQPMCSAILHQDAIDFMKNQQSELEMWKSLAVQDLTTDNKTATQMYEKAKQEMIRSQYVQSLKDKITELESKETLMKTCRLKPDMLVCKSCVDIGLSCDEIPDCINCSHQTKRYELVQVGSNFWGSYAIVQIDGKLEKVSLDRVIDIREEVLSSGK